MEYPENIKNWLSTIPKRRQEWFKRYVNQELFFILGWNYSKEEFNKVLEDKKSQIIKYMNEENDKKRKHGSKWKKHKERWFDYVKGIQERFDKYWLDYVRLFKEIYGVELKEKADWYLWLCPIHKENTPSLSIHVSKWVVKCYGCGNWWSNIINFIRNTTDKNVAEIYWMIEKYIFSKDESEEFFEYWKTKMNKRREKNN